MKKKRKYKSIRFIAKDQAELDNKLVSMLANPKVRFINQKPVKDGIQCLLHEEL